MPKWWCGEGVNPRPREDRWRSLIEDLRLTESKSLEFRGEFFNVFNHAQFYGPFTVDGYINDGPGGFGGVFGAASPRIGQLAVKFYF